MNDFSVFWYSLFGEEGQGHVTRST